MADTAQPPKTMTLRASFAMAFVEWNLHFLPGDHSAWLWGLKENWKPFCALLPGCILQSPFQRLQSCQILSMLIPLPPAWSCHRVTANLSPEDLFHFRQPSEHRIRTRFNPKLSYLQSGGQGNPGSGARPQGEGKWSLSLLCVFLSHLIATPLPSQITGQTASHTRVLLVYLDKMSLVLCECLTVVAPRRESSSRQYDGIFAEVTSPCMVVQPQALCFTMFPNHVGGMSSFQPWKLHMVRISLYKLTAELVQVLPHRKGLVLGSPCVRKAGRICIAKSNVSIRKEGPKVLILNSTPQPFFFKSRSFCLLCGAFSCLHF